MTDYLEVYRTFRDESMISPGQKIKVFISSICGVERYDRIAENFPNLGKETVTHRKHREFQTG